MLTRPAPQALSLHRCQIFEILQCKRYQVLFLGVLVQASTLPQVASTEEDGRVAVLLNCFACREFWATSEFAVV